MKHEDHPPIADYGIIGALLDSRRGGRFRVGAVDAGNGSQEYVEDTNVLRTRFESSDGALVVTDFMPLRGDINGRGGSAAPGEIHRLLRTGGPGALPPRGRAHDLAAGGHRRRAQLGLSLRLDPGRGPDGPGHGLDRAVLLARDHGLPGEEGAFGLCTFWLVDVLALSGRPAEAKAIFDGIADRANHVGLFPE